MQAYLLLRMGMQLTFTRNPAETINAWGGPTYAGALYAHGIDAIAVGCLAWTAAMAATRQRAPER